MVSVIGSCDTVCRLRNGVHRLGLRCLEDGGRAWLTVQRHQDRYWRVIDSLGSLTQGSVINVEVSNGRYLCSTFNSKFGIFHPLLAPFIGFPRIHQNVFYTFVDDDIGIFLYRLTCQDHQLRQTTQSIHK